MEKKDVLPVLAGAVVILAVALVVKPLLLGEPIGLGPSGSAAVWGPPAYVPPAPLPTATPFPDDGEAYTRSFRWTAIDGGVHTTVVTVPKALFLERRGTPRYFDHLAWGRHALAEADRPILEDLARQIAPSTTNPDMDYFRLMDLVFFVQQLPYAADDSTASYTEGVLPRYAMYVGGGVEYPKYPVETLVDGKGDCEDVVILMGGLLDALGYDTVLLKYSDHMALGVRMNEFNPYYARYTPRYFTYEGQHYYYIEGTEFDWGNVSVGSTDIWGRPHPIGDTSGVSIPSVRSETPEIIPLRYIPKPAEYRFRPALLPAEGA